MSVGHIRERSPNSFELKYDLRPGPDGEAPHQAQDGAR